MALVTITGPSIRSGLGRPDNRPWYAWAAGYQDGDSGGVITPLKDTGRPLKPVRGVLTFDAEAGASMYIENPDGKRYLVTIPDADTGLWEVIEAGVAFPPQTSQEQLNAAVGQYVEQNRERFRSYSVPVDPGDPDSLVQWYDETGDPIGGPVEPWTITQIPWAGIPDKPSVIGAGATQAQAREAIGAAALSDVEDLLESMPDGFDLSLTEPVTADYAAVPGEMVWVTAAGSVTITAPASPADGAMFGVLLGGEGDVTLSGGGNALGRDELSDIPLSTATVNVMLSLWKFDSPAGVWFPVGENSAPSVADIIGTTPFSRALLGIEDEEDGRRLLGALSRDDLGEAFSSSFTPPVIEAVTDVVTQTGYTGTSGSLSGLSIDPAPGEDVFVVVHGRRGPTAEITLDVKFGGVSIDPIRPMLMGNNVALNALSASFVQVFRVPGDGVDGSNAAIVVDWSASSSVSGSGNMDLSAFAFSASGVTGIGAVYGDGGTESGTALEQIVPSAPGRVVVNVFGCEPTSGGTPVGGYNQTVLRAMNTSTFGTAVAGWAPGASSVTFAASRPSGTDYFELAFELLGVVTSEVSALLLEDTTALGRSLVDAADAAAARTLLGAASSSDVSNRARAYVGPSGNVLRGESSALPGVLWSHPENTQHFTHIVPMVNDLAYLVERGGSVAVTKNGSPVVVDMSKAFYPDVDTVSFATPANGDTFVFEVTFPPGFQTRYGTKFGIAMSPTFHAKNVTIEIYDSVAASWINSTTRSGDTLGYAALHTQGGGGGANPITKMRVTCTNFDVNAVTYSFRVMNIFVVKYDSLLMREAFVDRLGGTIYGDILREADPGSANALARKAYVDTKQPKIMTGTSSTAVGTATKTVTLDSPWASHTPVAGDWFYITFTNGNNVSNPTLNINGTSNRVIQTANGGVNSANLAILPGLGIQMYFNGTSFVLPGPTYNSTLGEIGAAEILDPAQSSIRALTGRQAAVLKRRAVVSAVTSSATPSISMDAGDWSTISVGHNITSIGTTGTPEDLQTVNLRLVGTGSYTLAFGSAWNFGFGVAAPSAIANGQTIYITGRWNSATSKVDVLGVAESA